MKVDDISQLYIFIVRPSCSLLTDLFLPTLRRKQNLSGDAAPPGLAQAMQMRPPDGLLVFMRRFWLYENPLDALFFRLSA